MIRNYLKIAWRQLLKDSQFTLLNLLGLSAGLTCMLLLWFWVNDELSVDKFFEKDVQLYQLMERRLSEGFSQISDESSGLLGETLKNQMPEIEYAAAVAPPEWWGRFTLSVGEKNVKSIGQYVEKDYFNIFSFTLLEGKKGNVLSDKNSIVISDELATKLFNTTQNLIGKKIRFQQERDFFISGVFEKVPVHSSTQFDFVLSFEYLKDIQGWVKTWSNTGPHNFVLLKEGTNLAQFNKKIANVITENSGDSTRLVYATRFSDNYLKDTFDHGSRVGGRVEYVRLFSLIALFILAIACINFMNLSTAKASQRMKEVGIKKAVGAARSQLIFQFLGESFLLTSVAMLLAVGLAGLLLPAFNTLTGKQILLQFNPRLLLTIAGITVLTSLLAGSYPAFYLSGFQPIKILKSKFQSSVAEIFLRKGLVVFQFSLSVILIIGVLVVTEQIQYIQQTSPGYNKDNVIRFNTEGKILGTEEAFMAELKRIPDVLSVSFTFNNMVGRNFGTTGLDWEGKTPNASVYFEGFGTDYDFVETMGMQMLEGRFFSKKFGDESRKIVLNEAAVKEMNFTDPVGKKIKLFGEERQIIGVVKDFHFESLHEQVKPSYMTLTGLNNPWNKMMVRIKGRKQQETLAQIQQFYAKYNPGFPFDYNFLDEAYQQQYQTESRVGQLSRYFAVLAILISCLGLFGLATFTAQRRKKEIGIRKVLGATVGSVTRLLATDFLKLVAIAIAVASPIAWYFMNQWLAEFAYRINMEWWMFVVAGVVAVAIAFLTIGFQSVKAALANPVKSLRSE
jgi:putative ABC transport system permease protein